MRLVRYGVAGKESPGLIDADGVIRDLSAHIADIDGAMLNDAGLDRLRALDPVNLPAIDLLGIYPNMEGLALQGLLLLLAVVILFNRKRSAQAS